MTEQNIVHLAENTEPATDMPSSEIPTPPSLAGKYQFIKKLGQGSQAKVFLARRLSDNEKVAIKQIDIESVSNWKEYDLFRREAQVLSSLDINGVALFYEAVECLDDTPPRSFLVQEYIEGDSLGSMLKSGHRFTTDEVYDIIIQLLTILYQLQNRANPVIHRDIKPSNIMLTPINGGYYVSLIDFGAVANPQVQSGGSTTAGTFGYMPPEQLMCRPQPASDIYALAAVAVELFTGKSPADLPVKDFHIIFEPEMQSQPPALVNTLRKMLEPDCSRRLADCVQLIQTFKYYKNGDFKQTGSLKSIDSKYSKKLQEVVDFGAPGNIDLWQILDDETPRDIPQAYAQNNWSKRIHQSNSFNLVSDKHQNQKIPVFTGLLILALFIAGPVLMVIYELNSLTWLLGIALLYVILTTIILAISSRIVNSDSHRFAQIDKSSNKQNIVTPMPKTVSDLLKYGRKTIATIVSIKYVPAADIMVVKGALVAGDRPGFRISYKFNPPDDFRSEDLIHECIVYNEPENTYRVGDPFPILYYLDGQNFDEVVSSMPFPYPLQYISENDVVYNSTPGWEYLSILKSLTNYQLYGFIKYRNDLQKLAVEIDMISSEWLSETEFRVAALPILNCYLKAEQYAPVHVNCLNCFFYCLKHERYVVQINSYLSYYLSTMKIQSEEICKELINSILEDLPLSSNVAAKIVDLIDNSSAAYHAMMNIFSPKLADIVLKRNSLKYMHSEVLNKLCVYILKEKKYRQDYVQIICDYLHKRPIDESVITPTVITSIGVCASGFMDANCGNKIKLLLRTLVGVFFDCHNVALKLTVREQVKSVCDSKEQFDYYYKALSNPKLADEFRTG